MNDDGNRDFICFDDLVPARQIKPQPVPAGRQVADTEHKRMARHHLLSQQSPPVHCQMQEAASRFFGNRERQGDGRSPDGDRGKSRRRGGTVGLRPFRTGEGEEQNRKPQDKK